MQISTGYERYADHMQIVTDMFAPLVLSKQFIFIDMGVLVLHTACSSIIVLSIANECMCMK